ncbi:MAG: PQQ-binding-like beta-propeller repeat protein [Bacteroidota bacterium]
MKTTNILLVFLISTILIFGCKKDKQDSNPENEMFANAVWTWDSEQTMGFSSSPVPAIDLQNNSFFIVKSSTGINIVSLDQYGVKNWTVDRSNDSFSNSSGSVVLSENRLYYSSGRALFCYNKENGEEVWHFELESQSFYHNMLIKNNEAWITYGEGSQVMLKKLNSNGTEVWTVGYPNYSTNLGMASSGQKLILLNKDLFAYHVDVLSVSMLDGSVYWITNPDIESAGKDPVIDTDGNVYFSTFEGELVALNGEDGSIRWTFQDLTGQKGERFVNQGAINLLPNKDVIFSTTNLYCFDNNGIQKWKNSMDPVCSFTLGNNNILYGWMGYEYYDISIVAINASDGEMLPNNSSIIDTDLSWMVPPLAIDHQGNIIAVGFEKIYCITSLSTSLEEKGWSKIGKGYQNNCNMD